MKHFLFFLSFLFSVNSILGQEKLKLTENFPEILILDTIITNGADRAFVVEPLKNFIKIKSDTLVFQIVPMGAHSFGANGLNGITMTHHLKKMTFRKEKELDQLEFVAPYQNHFISFVVKIFDDGTAEAIVSALNSPFNFTIEGESVNVNTTVYKGMDTD